MSKHNVDISIQNTSPQAKGAAVLYTDKSLNNLQVSISYADDGLIDLTGGNPVSELAMGHSKTSLIFLKFQNSKLAKNGMKNMEVDLAKGWKKEFFSTSIGSFWCICPSTSGQVKSIGFQLKGIELSPKAGSRIDFSMDVLNISGLSSFEKILQIRKPPVGKDLEDLLDFDWLNKVRKIYITTDPQNPIVNKLSFYIANDMVKPIVPTDQKYDKGTPTLSLYFSYGSKPGYGALSNPKNAKDIIFNKKEEYGNYWQIEADTSGKLPVWNVKKYVHEILKTGSEGMVQFEINHLSTSLQEGIAPMYFSWNNIPGYNDGSKVLIIQKVLPPIIKSFVANPAQVVVDDQDHEVEVELSWEIDHKGGDTFLSWKDAKGNLQQFNVENKTSWQVKVNKEVDTFTLKTSFGPDGNKQYVSKELHIPTSYHLPEIVSFGADKEFIFEIRSWSNGLQRPSYEAVTFSWEVKHASEIQFVPQVVPANEQSLKGNFTCEKPTSFFSPASQPLALSIPSGWEGGKVSIVYDKVFTLNMSARSLKQVSPAKAEVLHQTLLLPVLNTHIPFLMKVSHYISWLLDADKSKSISVNLDKTKVIISPEFQKKVQKWMYFQLKIIADIKKVPEDFFQTAPQEAQLWIAEINSQVHREIVPLSYEILNTFNEIYQAIILSFDESRKLNLQSLMGVLQKLLSKRERLEKVIGIITSNWDYVGSQLSNIKQDGSLPNSILQMELNKLKKPIGKITELLISLNQIPFDIDD